MKKLICTAVVLGMLAVSANAIEITVAQVNGASADYNASTGTLTWSLGTSGLIKDDSGNTYLVDDADVSATLTGAVDTSNGGPQASGYFTGGTWDIYLYATGGAEIGYLTGTFNPNFQEAEIGPDENKLHGKGLVTVDTDSSYFTYAGMTWTATTAGILSDVTLLATMGDFDTYFEDYESDNATITLTTDTTGIPEPMTMAILGLGGLILARRRK